MNLQLTQKGLVSSGFQPVIGWTYAVHQVQTSQIT